MNEERFISTNQIIYKKGKTKFIEEEKYLIKTTKRFLNTLVSNYQGNYSLDKTNEIYYSKIAKVPTDGNDGAQSKFLKQIGYLNFGKFWEKKLSKLSTGEASLPGLLPSSQEALKIVKYEVLQYIASCEGFKVGVKGKNFCLRKFQKL